MPPAKVEVSGPDRDRPAGPSAPGRAGSAVDRHGRLIVDLDVADDLAAVGDRPDRSVRAGAVDGVAARCARADRAGIVDRADRTRIRNTVSARTARPVRAARCLGCAAGAAGDRSAVGQRRDRPCIRHAHAAHTAGAAGRAAGAPDSACPTDDPSAVGQRRDRPNPPAHLPARTAARPRPSFIAMMSSVFPAAILRRRPPDCAGVIPELCHRRNARNFRGVPTRTENPSAPSYKGVAWRADTVNIVLYFWPAGLLGEGPAARARPRTVSALMPGPSPRGRRGSGGLRAPRPAAGTRRK